MYLYPTKTCSSNDCEGNKLHWTGIEAKRTKCQYCQKDLIKVRVVGVNKNA